MNWSLKINIQKEIIFAITFEDWFLATLETVNLYHDQLTKIVGKVISGPQSNIQTSDSVMFFPEDIQFIRQGRELKTMSNRYGFITFDNQTQSTNWELNISGLLPAIPTVASAQPCLPIAAMLVPT